MTLIYHIAHIDRLAGILHDGFLYSDSVMQFHGCAGTEIGMPEVKALRRSKNIPCHEGLKVGDCVPFYFCPRSVMLYILHKSNHGKLDYAGGERPILHLELDAQAVADWAAKNNLRVSFTNENAASATACFNADISQIGKLDWRAIAASDWRNCMGGKQAEFLVEGRVPSFLIQRIGVIDEEVRDAVKEILWRENLYDTPVDVVPDWYY